MVKLADLIVRDLRAYVRSGAGDIMIPNYYVDGYEMDMFKVSERGYVTEYEVKVSRGDFKADFKKAPELFEKHKLGSTKHDRVKTGERLCNRFYFVVPQGLVKPEEVPEYAGLIYYTKAGRIEWMGDFRLVKNARLLHKRTMVDAHYKSIVATLMQREERWRWNAYIERREALIAFNKLHEKNR